jgi:hypothetical protein
MKRLWLCLLLAAFLLPAAAQMTLPRVYAQKLVLEDGSNPFVTWYKDKSAPEYLFRAWILERPDEVMNSDINGYHHLAIAQIGDGVKFPFTIISRVNLGNFPSQWVAGETLHLEVTHRETGEKVEWDVYIPEGTALIRMLDTPQVIPPHKLRESKPAQDKTEAGKQDKEQSSGCGACHGCD